MCLLVFPIVTDMVKDTYLTGGLENFANQTDENFIGKHPNIHAYQKLILKWDFGMSGIGRVVTIHGTFNKEDTALVGIFSLNIVEP